MSKGKVFMSAMSHYKKLENMYQKAPINKFYKPELRIGEGRTELSLQIRDDFFHAANAVHGSVYFKLLDDAAFFAVNSLVEDVFVLTVSFHVHFMRPISGGMVKTVGRVVQASGRIFVAESIIYDSDDRIVGKGSGNFIKSKYTLKADIGYR